MRLDTSKLARLTRFQVARVAQVAQGPVSPGKRGSEAVPPAAIRGGTRWHKSEAAPDGGKPAALAVPPCATSETPQVAQENTNEINGVTRVPPVPPKNINGGATRCATCAHRTPARTCGEPVAAGLLPRFGVVFVAAGDGGACPAWSFNPKTPADSASAPRLTPEQREALTGWTAEEIEQAGRYVALMTRRGLDAETVERVTDRLILRDREGDDRRLCLECAHLAGSGRCGAAARGALRNADRRLEPLPLILQRCEGFEPSL